MGTETRSMDQPTRCHHCSEPLASPIGCLSCHTIFPPASNLTHFDRLGLPVRFDLQPEDLDRSYLAWSRELHPDFYQTRSADDQSMSLKMSAALNDAYSTLKDPFKRAEYMLYLMGGPSPSEHRAMPAGFLEGVLELRMEIEEAREEGGAGGPASEELLARIRAERTACLEQLREAFGRLNGLNGGSQEDRYAIRERLNTVKYYDGLIRELVAPA